MLPQVLPQQQEKRGNYRYCKVRHMPGVAQDNITQVDEEWPIASHFDRFVTRRTWVALAIASLTMIVIVPAASWRSVGEQRCRSAEA